MLLTMGEPEGNNAVRGGGRARRAAGYLGKYVLPGLLVAAILAAAGLAYRSATNDEEELRGGWWPERSVTYRCDSDSGCLGADHVVFNSIVNLPSYGDERAFADARPAAANRSQNLNLLEVAPGEEIIVRAYVDNNANPNRAGPGEGVAVDTRMRFAIPDEAADDQLLWAVLSAANAKPRTVSDTVRLVGDEPFSLSYVEGSANLYNSVFESGFRLSSAIISDGAALGIKEAEGKFCCALDGYYPPCDPMEPGCEVFDSLVEIKLRVNDPEQASGIDTSVG